MLSFGCCGPQATIESVQNEATTTKSFTTIKKFSNGKLVEETQSVRQYRNGKLDTTNGEDHTTPAEEDDEDDESQKKRHRLQVNRQNISNASIVSSLSAKSKSDRTSTTFPLEHIIGKELIHLQNQSMEETIPVHQALGTSAQQPLVALYLAASWKPTCQRFTRTLTDLHQRVLHHSVNIVYVSVDRTREEFLQAIRSFPTTWWALPRPLATKVHAKLVQTLQIVSTPMLLILHAHNGTVACVNAVKEIQRINRLDQNYCEQLQQLSTKWQHTIGIPLEDIPPKQRRRVKDDASVNSWEESSIASPSPLRNMSNVSFPMNGTDLRTPLLFLEQSTDNTQSSPQT